MKFLVDQRQSIIKALKKCGNEVLLLEHLPRGNENIVIVATVVCT